MAKRKCCNKHGYYHNDICPGCLSAAAPYLYDTAKEFIAGWPHFCKCINWKVSGMDAEAIRFMNEVPAKIATGIVKAEKGV